MRGCSGFDNGSSVLIAVIPGGPKRQSPDHEAPQMQSPVRASQSPRNDRRRLQSKCMTITATTAPRNDRLDQAGAVAVRGGPDRADRDAAVLARGLQRHRQGRSSDAAEFRHAVHRSRFPRSAADHRHHCNHFGRDLLRCRGADGMAGVAHRHARAAVHPRAGHGLVRDAAVSRRCRLGIAGGAQQRIAEPALSLRDRRRGRPASVQYLFADRNHLCHLLLHVSVRVRAGRQRAR